MCLIFNKALTDHQITSLKHYIMFFCNTIYYFLMYNHNFTDIKMKVKLPKVLKNLL